MAVGKHIAWHEPNQLEKVTNWAANGCTDAEMAQNIGISRSTFYAWLGKYQDISDAVKKGREMCVQQVENTFFRRIMGLCEEVTETKEVEQKMVDGELVTVHRVVKTTTKRLAPDMTGLIFYLKNKAGYSSEPDVNVDVDVLPTFIYSR